MTILCAAPDPGLGIALRLSVYLDCQSRAIGENGFLALAGGPVAGGLLSGMVTIFVALIGYRLILSRTPGVRDGVGWAVRLGTVLALVTSWSAFETMVYHVAADGPGELAQLILPAAGLSPEQFDGRVQQAYDDMRIGFTSTSGSSTVDPQPAAGSAAANQVPAQLQIRGNAPSPQLASLFVITTIGSIAAFHMAIGILLAVAPIGIMGLLFDATLGLFNGWLRALGGAALALLAAQIVALVTLFTVETELGNLSTYLQGFLQGFGSDSIDLQALPTIVYLSAVMMLVSVAAAMRMASAIRLSAPSGAQNMNTAAASGRTGPTMLRPPGQAKAGETAPSSESDTGQPRVAAVAATLAATARREQGRQESRGIPAAPTRQLLGNQTTSLGGSLPPAGLGVAGRRSTARPTRTATMRDIKA